MPESRERSARTDVLRLRPELPVLLVSGFCDPSITLPPNIPREPAGAVCRRDLLGRVGARHPRRKSPQADGGSGHGRFSRSGARIRGRSDDGATEGAPRAGGRGLLRVIAVVDRPGGQGVDRERERVGRVVRGRGRRGRATQDHVRDLRLSACLPATARFKWKRAVLRDRDV